MQAGLPALPAHAHHRLPGSLINVTLRKALPTQEVPIDLNGRIFDEGISKTLAAVGWTVVPSDVFSLQPEKLILASEPRGGARLSVSGIS